MDFIGIGIPIQENRFSDHQATILSLIWTMASCGFDTILRGDSTNDSFYYKYNWRDCVFYVGNQKVSETFFWEKFS